ncbi:MAG: hypothetical protein QX194_02225 [Methylococcales bacterium]
MYIQDTDDTDDTNKFTYSKDIADSEFQPPPLPEVLCWEHELNKPLIGTIVTFSSFEHPQFGLQETVIVERENGEFVSAILNDYLQNAMMMQNGDIGNFIFIENQGQAKSKNGNTYNKFELVIG